MGQQGVHLNKHGLRQEKKEKAANLTEDLALNRTKWRRKIHVSDKEFLE